MPGMLRALSTAASHAPPAPCVHIPSPAAAHVLAPLPILPSPSLLLLAHTAFGWQQTYCSLCMVVPHWPSPPPWHCPVGLLLSMVTLSCCTSVLVDASPPSPPFSRAHACCCAPAHGHLRAATHPLLARAPTGSGLAVSSCSHSLPTEPHAQLTRHGSTLVVQMGLLWGSRSPAVDVTICPELLLLNHPRLKLAVGLTRAHPGWRSLATLWGSPVLIGAHLCSLGLTCAHRGSPVLPSSRSLACSPAGAHPWLTLTSSLHLVVAAAAAAPDTSFRSGTGPGAGRARQGRGGKGRLSPALSFSQAGSVGAASSSHSRSVSPDGHRPLHTLALGRAMLHSALGAATVLSCAWVLHGQSCPLLLPPSSSSPSSSPALAPSCSPCSPCQIAPRCHRGRGLRAGSAQPGAAPA